VASVAATSGGPGSPSCVSSSQAAQSVGKRVTICGPVADASYQARTSGGPTFLNFDRPYPNHTFVALIWGENRGKFNPPPDQQFGHGKNVCVTGSVVMYRGKPEIVVSDPSQISVC
jgi:DNA/RNA endonuclease YhcR with UshA esterase domain